MEHWYGHAKDKQTVGLTFHRLKLTSCPSELMLCIVL